MTMFKTWLFGVVAAAMALSILYGLLPKGAMMTVAKCVGSVILVLVMLRPIISLETWALFDTYNSLEREIASQTESLAEKNLWEMKTLIEEECAAYISEKGAQMGVEVHAEVRCYVREGVPFPGEVSLNIPYHHNLSECIAQELEIAPSKQHWQEN